MFNSTKLINDYCGNATNARIYDDELHLFSSCFLFTCIENPIYFFATLVISFMIGNLRQPDEFCWRGLLQRGKKIELLFLFTEYLAIAAYFTCVLVDQLNYGTIYGQDYNGYVNFAFKLSTVLLLSHYTLKSLRCFNYSSCRLIALNLILAACLCVEIYHISWFKVRFRIFSFIDGRFIYCYVKVIAIISYFSLFNFSFFVTKRHSLFYESFANYYDSSFNLDTIVDVNTCQRSFISKLFFNWVQPFLVKAANNQVRNVADIFHLPEELTSRMVKERIQITCANLRNEQVTVHETSQENDEITGEDESVLVNRPSMPNRLIDINRPITQFKLKSLVWRCYRSELGRVSNLKLIADVFAFFSPIILNKLILYIDSKDFSADGFLLVFALFASSLVSSICVNLYDFQINNICIKVKSTVINLVYLKLFSLRTSTLHNNFSNGQLINFTSVDCDRIANFFSSIFLLFSMPIQVVIALYLLYLQIGYSFIAGFIFSILLIGVNKYISYKIALISGKLLAFKDERIKLTAKLINGIKVIKMNHWQEIYTKQIDECRRNEVKMLKQKKYLDCVCVYSWATTPTIISFFTFCTFVLLGNKLTAANVFTSLALLNMMIVPLNCLPFVFTGILESWISVNRVQTFLDASPDEDMLSEQQSTDQLSEQSDDQEHIINFDDVICEHKSSNEYKFLLGPIDLKVKRGELLGVVGKISAGKTSLLNAILSEIPLKKEGCLRSGQIKLQYKGKGIGYIAQTPFIQNDTIRNNILFGKIFEYKLYNDVIDACELREDLKAFSDYDNTMVSDRGQSLSGGQKQRISLARALYQVKEFDLYLIDDPFNALDNQVAAQIYENCILKFLSSKTRIVCTNQYEYLKEADRIVVLENGSIKKVGKSDEILDELSKQPSSGKNLIKNPSERLHNLIIGEPSNNFEEEMNKGRVVLSVYQTYVKAISITLSTFIIAFLILMRSSQTTSDYWLSYWTNKLKIDVDTDTKFFLQIFLIIVLVNSFLAAFRAFLFAYGCINAATNLYKKLFNTVLNSSISFFNVRPIGQILNRFASDVFHIDENLPFTLNIFLATLIGAIATLIVTCYSSPLCILILILLCFPCYKIQYLYRQGSMILKRFSTNTLSPLYSQFNESILGLTTIRAYRGSRRFIKHFEEKVDMQNSTNYSLKACTQWLNLRIQLIGISLSCTIALTGCVFHYYGFVQQPSLIALGLVYSLQATGLLSSLISSFTSLEIDFISVERLIQYFDNADKEKPGMIKLADFPKRGEIIFENVRFKYKSDSNCALDSLSFKIESNQFVGVVGRTGAGKSSIFQCLFRMYDLLDGSIYIDDQNIKLLHIDTLRNSMYILPQDPFLFDGTIRDNLDPKKTLTDLDIWEAIDRCEAKAIILKLGGLNSIINDQESNVSSGEKQLICIIRALLCKVKILCLDEATSSLDQNFETNICKTIRKAFNQSTILMISHRPSSVLNCDVVMVIDEGRLLEHGTPDKLICDSKSKFSKMWLLQQNKG